MEVNGQEWFDRVRNMSVSSGYGQITDKAICLVLTEAGKIKEKQQSDLEIVQKALGDDKMVIYCNGGWVVDLINGSEEIACSDDYESLLTWAKQAIGEE